MPTDDAPRRDYLPPMAERFPLALPATRFVYEAVVVVVETVAAGLGIVRRTGAAGSALCAGAALARGRTALPGVTPLAGVAALTARAAPLAAG